MTFCDSNFKYLVIIDAVYDSNILKVGIYGLVYDVIILQVRLWLGI